MRPPVGECVSTQVSPVVPLIPNLPVRSPPRFPNYFDLKKSGVVGGRVGGVINGCDKENGPEPLG